MSNNNELTSLKNQRAKYVSARSKVDQVIKSLESVSSDLSDKKKFVAPKIDSINGKVSDVLTDMRNTKIKLNSAINTLDSKISLAIKEQEEQPIK